MSALTKSEEVQLLASQIMPIVLLTQLVKGVLPLYYKYILYYNIYTLHMYTPYTCLLSLLPIYIYILYRYILSLIIMTLTHIHIYTYIHAPIGLSYATGGILLGGKDWAWSTASMVTAAIVCIGKS